MEKIKKIPVIIDTDPGIDDAVALLLAYKNIEYFDIKLLCSTAGNTPIEQSTKNVQFFAENFFPGVRVAKGIEKPLVRSDAKNAKNIHGKTGLGAFTFSDSNYPVEKDSAKAMFEVLSNSDEPITIITLGPLTNVARLLITYPNAKDYIKEIYCMIGSIEGTGNITPYAEFNAYFDPEAFDIVSKSGIKLIINSMELGEHAQISKDQLIPDGFTSLKSKLIYELVLGKKDDPSDKIIYLYDANSICAITNPNFYDFTPCNIEVSTRKEDYGKCILTEDINGKHLYQTLKNKNNFGKYIIHSLENL